MKGVMRDESYSLKMNKSGKNMLEVISEKEIKLVIKQNRTPLKDKRWSPLTILLHYPKGILKVDYIKVR